MTTADGSHQTTAGAAGHRSAQNILAERRSVVQEIDVLDRELAQRRGIGPVTTITEAEGR